MLIAKYFNLKWQYILDIGLLMMYMYVCTCMYVHVYMYMYICTCMYVHVCMCMYVCTCMYVHVCMYMYVCTCMYVHVCMYMYVCTCMYVHVCMYMYICTCMYPSDTFPRRRAITMCTFCAKLRRRARRRHPRACLDALLYQTTRVNRYKLI